MRRDPRVLVVIAFASVLALPRFALDTRWGHRRVAFGYSGISYVTPRAG